MSEERYEQPSVDSELLYEESYERVRRELEALPADRVSEINLEPMVAVSATLGILPELHALRAELARRLPAFDLEEFDKLEDYAMALAHAHTVYAMSLKPPEGLRELHAAGVRRCDHLRRREQSPTMATLAGDMRARAFTLLVEAYENARRAITYVRWKQGDVDSIIPSLYAARNTGRRRHPDDTDTDATFDTEESESTDQESTLPGIDPSGTEKTPATGGSAGTLTATPRSSSVANRQPNCVGNGAADPTGTAASAPKAGKPCADE